MKNHINELCFNQSLLCVIFCPVPAKMIFQLNCTKMVQPLVVFITKFSFTLLQFCSQLKLSEFYRWVTKSRGLQSILSSTITQETDTCKWCRHTQAEPPTVAQVRMFFIVIPNTQKNIKTSKSKVGATITLWIRTACAAKLGFNLIYTKVPCQ